MAREIRALGLDLLDSPQTRLRTFIDPFEGLLECRRTSPARIIVNVADIGARETRLLRSLATLAGAPPIVVVVPTTVGRSRDATAALRGYAVIDKGELVRELHDVIDRPAGNSADASSESSTDEATSGSVLEGPTTRPPSTAAGPIADIQRELEWMRMLTPRLGDLEEILRVTLERSIAELDAARGSVQFLDRTGRELRVSKAIGPGAAMLEEMVRPADVGIAGSVIRQRRARRGESAIPESEGLPRPAQADLAGPYLSVPIAFSGKLVGVLHVVREFGAARFTEQDETRLTSMVSSAAGFIKNAMDLAEKERLTLIDPLTGLYNRRYFDQQFPLEIRRAQRFQRSITLLLLDIDDFKVYNDLHGYLEGDDVLRRVAKVLRRTFRQVDVVARWGGEEFAILLPETDKSLGGETPAFVARLLDAMARQSFAHGDTQPGGSLTLSGGSASYPDDTHDPGELLALANRALRRAKEEGKARILQT